MGGGAPPGRGRAAAEAPRHRHRENGERPPQNRLALRHADPLAGSPMGASSLHLLNGSLGCFHPEVTQSDTSLSSFTSQSTCHSGDMRASGSTQHALRAQVPQGELRAGDRPAPRPHGRPRAFRPARVELTRSGLLSSESDISLRVQPGESAPPPGPLPDLSDKKQLEHDSGVSCCQKNS